MSASDPRGDLRVADLDPTDPVPAGQVLLDVREQAEWDAGHAPGALHIPLGDVPVRAAEIAATKVVVVCRVGARSAIAAAWLNEAGFEARNLVDGMVAWQAADLPITAADGVEPTIV